MTPRLETARLILRGFTLDDFPAHAALWADPRTTAFFGGYAYDEETCWLRFMRNWGQWAMYGYGYWGIEDKASGRYIGNAGLFNAKRGVDLPYRDLPEAGWVLHPDYHSQGLMPEALTAIFAWADAHIDAPQSWAMINPGNLASQKIAARFGYVRAQDATYKDKPVWTFLRQRR